MYLCTSVLLYLIFLFLFFIIPASTEFYTLSLHDALPICRRQHTSYFPIEISRTALAMCARELGDIDSMSRSEEHTSELQSLTNLVCRLLLEKKKRQARAN